MIITGGGSGIGRATAELFGARSARLVLVGRQSEPLQTVAREVSRQGGTAMAVVQDITVTGAAEHIVRTTMERFARVDVLVNNAGVPGEGVPLECVSDALWEEIVATNLTAAFRMLRATLPIFVQQRHGAVLNVSSTAAVRAMRDMAAYSASKAGLLALTRAVARDYAAHGVRCNAVCPGTTATRMTSHLLNGSSGEARLLAGIPLGRVADPREIAAVIVQLCSEAWSYVTGTIVTADGGQSSL